MLTFATVLAHHHAAPSWDGPPRPAVVVIALLAATVIVATLVALRHPSRRALAVLGERFARGEIDHDEFRRRRTELRAQWRNR